MQESEPYFISRKRTVRRVYWGRIIVVLVVAALLVMGGVFWFSRTAGKISAPAREYWFVSMGEYADLGQASARAATVAEIGGAGYLYGNAPYAVSAACYKEKSDAQKVSDRMNGEGETSSLFSLRCASVSVRKPKENAALAKKMLVRPAELFDELYDISVRTETKELSETAALYAALKMSVACGEYAQDCGELEGVTGEYLVSLFLALSSTLDTLARSTEKVPQAFKYALCESAVKICTVTESFADRLKNEK